MANEVNNKATLNQVLEYLKKVRELLPDITDREEKRRIHAVLSDFHHRASKENNFVLTRKIKG